MSGAGGLEAGGAIGTVLPTGKVGKAMDKLGTWRAGDGWIRFFCYRLKLKQ